MIEELTEDQALNQGLTPFTPPKQKHPREVFELLHFRASTVCVLKLAGYTKSDIARITKLSPPTIDKYIEMGKEEYPRIRRELC